MVIGFNHLPQSSLYMIDLAGSIVDRYDKMFCTRADCDKQDLKHYSPGSTFTIFDVDSVRCGLLICHDFRYPKLPCEYKRVALSLC